MNDDKTIAVKQIPLKNINPKSSAIPDSVKKIGKYQILGVIAKGGMGVVYKAWHPDLKKEVVLKKMTGHKNKDLRERFTKEAQILLNMQSPYIINFFDYFHEGPFLYIVEEFVNGMDLKQIISKVGMLEPRIALLILQDACLGLKFSHSRKVVHRDIKPGNILVSRKAEVKLTDFGIASEHDAQGEDQENRQNGVTLGTPAYMPPEQFENSNSVDERADIFALGVMLYEMVTGRKPFEAYTGKESMRQLKNRRYTDPRKYDKTIPCVVVKLIRKMISSNPKQRYSSVNPILSKVRRYLSNFDTHAVRVELARIVISPVNPKRPVFIKKVNYWKNTFIAVLSVLFLCSGLYWYYRTGLVFRTLLKPWYTPVTFDIKMWKPYSPVSDLPVQVAFFTGGKTIDYINGSKRVLKQASPKDGVTESSRIASKKAHYEIEPVFLRPGDYHIKIVYADMVYWRSVYVGKEPVLIKDDFSQYESIRFQCVWEVFDAHTGKNITNKSQFLVNYNNRWVPYEDVPKHKLLTNRVWVFKIHCDGYVDDVFSCDIECLQDYFNFHCELVREEVPPIKIE